MGINHKILLAGLVHLTVVTFVVMIVINALGGAGYKGLFNQSTGQVSDNYKTYITPAGFTFSIWSVIYIFLGAASIYSLASVYRKSDGSSKRVYIQPVILNWLFYSALTTNYGLNAVWMVLWDRKLMVAASIILLLIACTGWLSFAIAVIRGKRAMEKKTELTGLTKNVVFKEVRLQRILIHNGIALYATWTTTATLLNINIAFQYFGDTNAETTSLVCLSILLIMVVGWFIIENSYWLDPYIRYTITQYPVIIFGTFGILSKQSDQNRPDGPVPESIRILTWIILGVASIQLSIRLAIVIYRYRTRPLFEIEPVPTTVQDE